LTSWPPCHRGLSSQCRLGDLRAFAMSPHSRHSDTIDPRETSPAMRLLAIANTELARVQSQPATCYASASVHRGMRGLAPVSGQPDDLANAAAELDRFTGDPGPLLTVQDG
jgi:hypothetical protein